MATQQVGANSSTDDKKCKSVDQLLAEVTQELDRVEAKKLPALKAELEAFKKKLDGMVSDYTAKFPALREKWCAQQKVLETLEASLKCAIPDWKAIVEDCICKKRQALHCQKQRIWRRKQCCYGALQRQSAEATWAFNEAKARLDGLAANVQRISATQADNDKLIKDITSYLSGDKLLALNALFFKLLRNQRKLRPHDASGDCKAFDNEQPDALCPCKECDPDPDECTSSSKAAPSTKPPRPLPASWLLDPSTYQEALNCAWYDYHDAKEAAAAAESKFKAAPDDLASLEKALDAAEKALDDEINRCLKEKSAADKDCCKETGATQAAESQKGAE